MEINKSLNKGVSIAPLVIFRIIFGSLLLFSTIRFMVYGWVNQIYIQPKFHFTYLGFDWIKVLPNQWMYLPFILMTLGAIGIILGYFYRFSVILFFTAFTYVELVDKSTYLNHYYFVSLMTFLMIFVPAHKDFSLDARRKPRIQTSLVPRWTILILQFQLAVVYFFAGVAKIHPDWLLEAQPLKLWLQAFRDLPVVGNLLASSWVAFVFSWFGCIYDLTIPFLLWSKRFRKYAYFFVVFFHLITWLLFPIGVFPWVMIFSTFIFFSVEFHERILYKLKIGLKWKNSGEAKNANTSKFTYSLLALYISIQLLLPFRYLLYPKAGELFWNEEGFRFSWRVMLMEKKGMATFYVEDPISHGSIEVDNYAYLTPQQIDQMARQPDMILQFAHFLGEKYRDTTLHFAHQTIHLKDPRISVEAYVTLNGRPNQLFVSRKWNLVEQHYNLKHRTWVEPFNK